MQSDGDLCPTANPEPRVLTSAHGKWGKHLSSEGSGFFVFFFNHFFLLFFLHGGSEEFLVNPTIPSLSFTQFVFPVCPQLWGCLQWCYPVGRSIKETVHSGIRFAQFFHHPKSTVQCKSLGLPCKLFHSVWFWHPFHKYLFLTLLLHSSLQFW